MRRWLFWAHLVSGVAAGLLILFFSVTGSLLAFERQVVAHTDAAYRVRAAGTRVPLGELVEHAPARVTGITVHAEADAPVELQAGRRDVYMGDPYTGGVKGPASPEARGFFARVEEFHRWFGLEETHREAASVVKGAAVLVFVFLIVSGAVLWVPKAWTGMAVRGGLVPRWDGSGRAKLFNWHKVAGAWAGVPLLAIALTGVVMAYPWANRLLFQLAGTPVPVRGDGPGGPGGPGDGRSGRPPGGEHATQAGRDGRGPDGGRHAHDGEAGRDAGGTGGVDLDGCFAAAERAVDGWKSVALRMPRGGELRYPVSLSADRSEGGHPEARVQVTVMPGGDGQLVVRQVPFASQPRGQRWRAWVRFTHTGEAGGVLGEGVAFLAAWGGVVLVVTGLGLSYGRWRRWGNRRAQGVGATG